MSRGTLDPARFLRISLTRLSLSPAGFPKTILLSSVRFLQSEPRCARTPVWALSLSLAATQEIIVIFSSSGYLDVSVRRVPLHALFGLTALIGAWMAGVLPAGFPHSDICGSLDICSSPQLFAAYHVFHRLSVPRHPPCALLRLTFCPAASRGYGFRWLHAPACSLVLVFE